MKNTEKELKNILEISNLYVDDSKLQTLERDIDRILSWVEQLDEIETTGISPMIHPFNEECLSFESTPTAAMSHEDVLRNATHKNSTYIVVPKVV